MESKSFVQQNNFSNHVQKDVDELTQQPNSLSDSINARFTHFSKDKFRWINIAGNEILNVFPSQSHSVRWCFEKAFTPVVVTPIIFDFVFTLHDGTIVNLQVTFNSNEDADVIQSLVKAEIDADLTLAAYNITTSFVSPHLDDYATTNNTNLSCFMIYGDSNGDRFNLTADQLIGPTQPKKQIVIFYAGFDTQNLDAIGMTSLDTSAFLWTTDDNSFVGGYGQIWELKFQNKIFQSANLIYSKALNFSKRYQIEAYGKISTNHRRILYFTDNFNVPRSIEVDTDEIALKSESFLNISPTAAVKKINIIAVQNFGGALRTGSYQFSAQYIDKFNNETNFFPLTNIVPIIDEHDSDPYTEIDGADPNTLTAKAIKLQVLDVDTDYRFIRFVVVKHVNGTIETVAFNKKEITNNTVEVLYIGNEIETPIDFSQVDNKQVFYTRIKTISHKDNRFFGANISLHGNYAYQQFANQITSEPVVKEVGQDYKTALLTTEDKSFTRGEIIPFGIVFYFRDGSKSFVYHIPGSDDIVPSRVYTSAQTYPTGLGYVSGNVLHHKMPEIFDVDQNYKLWTNTGFSENIRILGRQFKNIQIPDDLKSQIVGFSIVRGKRSYPNRHIVAQGLIFPCFNDNAIPERVRPTRMFGNHSLGTSTLQDLVTFHSLDLDFGFYDYTFAFGDELQIVGLYQGEIDDYSTSEAYATLYKDHSVLLPIPAKTQILDFKIVNPSQIEVVGTNPLSFRNIPIGTTDETFRRHTKCAVLQLQSFENDPNLTIFTNTGGTLGTLSQPVPIANEISYKFAANIVRNSLSFFGDVGDIVYESIGHFQPITEDSPSLFDVTVYGGTSFISRYSFRRELRWTNGTFQNNIEFYLESEINAQYRHGSYYEKIVMFDGTNGELDKIEEPNERKYNPEYSVKNNQETLRARPSSAVIQSDFPTMIVYSQQAILGEVSDSYRILKANDYILVPEEFGEITKLDTLLDGLYFWQRSAFAKLPVNPSSFIPSEDGDVVEVTSGVNVLTREHYISEQYGLQHQWGQTKSPKAFYWFDSVNNIHFRFAQDGLSPISIVNNWESFFHNSFKGNIYSKDNPLNFEGVNAFYDLERNEVWFTFFDKYVEDEVDIETQKTVVFQESAAYGIPSGYNGLYSATPYLGISHQGKLLTFSKQDGAGGLRVWVHLESSERGKFYGTIYPSVLEFISNMYRNQEKVFDVHHLSIQSDNNAFFTNGIFTTDQLTRNIDFATTQFLTKKGSLWRFPVGFNDTSRERMRDLYMKSRFVLNNQSGEIVRVMDSKTIFRISKI